LGKRRAEAAGRRRTETGGGASKGGVGVPVVGVPEGSGEVTRELPRDDVVLRGSRLSGRRRGRAAAEARAHRHSGSGDLARENEIGQACELQWVAAVLLEHWIGGGRRRRRLLTGSRGCGGAPARWGAREKEKQCKCRRVKARVGSWGALGHAQGPEEGTAAWEQLLATDRMRGASSGGGATWRSEERASVGWGASVRVLGRHVAQREAARGSRCSAHGRRGRRDRAERKIERGGLEVDEEGPSCNLSKVQGLHCKARLTFKP
jgi:hypothetical protein